MTETSISLNLNVTGRCLVQYRRPLAGNVSDNIENDLSMQVKPVVIQVLPT